MARCVRVTPASCLCPLALNERGRDLPQGCAVDMLKLENDQHTYSKDQKKYILNKEDPTWLSFAHTFLGDINEALDTKNAELAERPANKFKNAQLRGENITDMKLMGEAIKDMQRFEYESKRFAVVTDVLGQTQRCICLYCAPHWLVLTCLFSARSEAAKILSTVEIEQSLAVAMPQKFSKEDQEAFRSLLGDSHENPALSPANKLRLIMLYAISQFPGKEVPAQLRMSLVQVCRSFPHCAFDS
jgi:hypothetical protein